MAAKKLNELPPSYANLAYEKETVAGPSAPKAPDENLGHGSREPAASPSAPIEDEDSQRIPDVKPHSLVFEDVYDACVQFVDDSCCYGSKFINQMKLTDIHNTRALHYILESYGEMREMDDSSRAYKGDPVDGPENGPAPHVWDIRVRSPRELFEDDWTWKEIPHTQTVKTCYRCRGSGEEDCWKCRGSSYVNCDRCHGSGRKDEEKCSSCNGSGKKRCTRCRRGKVTCGKCDGYKKLVHYKGVNVTWKNHREEFVTDIGNLSKELLLKTPPTVLFQEQSEKVQPVISADTAVNIASVRLLIKHDSAFADELIIRQRHTLVGYPFTNIKYTWKDRNGEFYVYGTERKVFFENYPQQCCCCTCC